MDAIQQSHDVREVLPLPCDPGNADVNRARPHVRIDLRCQQND
jgi:hypothetical protein